jgi:SpoVK/Ycf46/Vps4 family AAA+-type ATPase
VAATCNNVSALPPELIRKGRFDELFFVDLPNDAERAAILLIHFKKRHMNAESFDMMRLVAATAGFSGAEIEAAIQSAMYASFADKAPITTETLLREVNSTSPLSVTRAEDVARLREWAKTRCVFAA